MDQPYRDDAPADEQELVRRVRSGDDSAFEVVFRRFLGPMRDFALRYVGSTDEAAELVQDVFFHVWRARASWRVRTTLKAYLFRAVRNAALDRLARERVSRRWREREVGRGVAEPFARAADAVTLEAELRSVLDGALAKLPERRRLVVTLRWDEGLSYAEIAEVMGISVRTVEHTIAAALRDLRESMGGR